MTRLLSTNAAPPLKRSRLLRRLPDSAGYVVWLQAPYGHGKSVLASQWADELEQDGWRVLWLSLMGEDVRGLLARELDLPLDAPWPILHHHLWNTPTLLVLEELEGTEHLTPLLHHPRGLMLLASRQPLPEPELPRLRAEGYLIHLTAQELCFTLDEAGCLFADPQEAQVQWQRTGGWPLPLKLAALTGVAGTAADQRALIRGMRDSLNGAQWEEALLLSTLNYLPTPQANLHTQQLVSAGFVQPLEVGFRLHPFMADQIQANFPHEVQLAVRGGARRLPPVLRGEAYEKAGLLPELAELLISDIELGLLYPTQVMRWAALAPLTEAVATPARVIRLVCQADALANQGRTQQALPLVQQAAELIVDDPDLALTVYRRAVWWLVETQQWADAETIIRRAEMLMPQADPVIVARYLNNASRYHFERHDYPLGEEMLRQALELLPAGHMRRSGMLMNLGLLRFYQHGDMESRIKLFEDVLHDAEAAEHVAALRSAAHYDLGRQLLLLSEVPRARAHFEQAVLHGHNSPLNRLAAQGFLLLMQGDFGAIPPLLTQLEQWESYMHVNQLRAFTALHLLNLKRQDEALALMQAMPAVSRDDPHTKPLWQAVLALALHACGNTAEASGHLQDPGSDDREGLLYWYAARYRVARDQSALQAFLNQTRCGSNLLQALIPLADLPPDRPDLARHYPLPEVLKSGWKAAIQMRLSEIPPLEITTLGRLDVKLLGQRVNLTQRPREILLLLLLGKNREQIADALWPELEPAAVRNNLNFNFSALRKVIEPWGVPTYLLESGLQNVRSDLQDLHTALKHEQAKDLLRLYTGDFAPQVDLPSVQEQRDALRQQVVSGLEAAARRSPEHAQTYLERALELDPVSEQTLGLLVEHLERQGRKRQAQARRAAFQEQVQRELG